MNRSQAIFLKGGSNSALWKTLGLLFLVFTSCNSDEQFKKDILGKWKYEGIFIDEFIGFSRLEANSPLVKDWHSLINDSEIWSFKTSRELIVTGRIQDLNPNLKYQILDSELRMNYIDTDQMEKNIAQFTILEINSNTMFIEPLHKKSDDDTVFAFTRD
ncbi:hypothetical protein [Nonlabens dokdonensis]|uniref:hypothetical protein n=1 Tax=Nonlabens dokdonensis TaxID=328515 RepID=UPI0011D2460E|nr:hypothetical protein [Nonlabens dokdonensis]